MPDTAMFANFIKLQSNQVDAVILETVVGMNLIRNANLNGLIVPLRFEMNEPGPESFANIMISNVADPNNRFFNILQNAVSIVQNTEEYKQIIARYMSVQ
jgi:ABC-type amino acid transport substrate-binding protein